MSAQVDVGGGVQAAVSVLLTPVAAPSFVCVCGRSLVVVGRAGVDIALTCVADCTAGCVLTQAPSHRVARGRLLAHENRRRPWGMSGRHDRTRSYLSGWQRTTIFGIVARPAVRRSAVDGVAWPSWIGPQVSSQRRGTQLWMMSPIGSSVPSARSVNPGPWANRRTGRCEASGRRPMSAACSTDPNTMW